MLKGAVTTKGDVYGDRQEVLRSVQEYYGKVLNQSKDLQTNACTAVPPPPRFRAAMKNVPSAVLEKFYGCGNPIPEGIEGLNVLDLGCGSGRDCYIASQFSGKNGKIYGIDMTDEQLKTARDAQEEFRTKNPDAAPLTFLKGFIEDPIAAGVPKEGIDVVISNCVVNLSPAKRLVLEGAYNVLKNGGEFYFSDVYCDRRLPVEVRQHELLFGECIAGALYVGDFTDLCKAVGFADPRVVTARKMSVSGKKLSDVLGNATFYSITYRLFKLPESLETRCEDYGQIAFYKGNVPDAPHKFDLDDHHRFETNRPVLVCGNTASMLQETYLKKYFRVEGDRSAHYGVFPGCGGGPVTVKETESQEEENTESSCGGGGCCSGGGGCC